MWRSKALALVPYGVVLWWMRRKARPLHRPPTMAEHRDAALSPRVLPPYDGIRER